MVLRPARLLPPKRLLTPRSARHLSTTNRGLLPGAPVPTGTGLTPAGLIQLSGRTMPPLYPGTPTGYQTQRLTSVLSPRGRRHT
jgi:hypothetical protein